MSNRAKQITKKLLYVPEMEEDSFKSSVDQDLKSVFLILRKFPNYGVLETAISYTALTSDYVIGVTSTASARTITLPLAVSMDPGQLLIVKDQSGGAGTNNITLDGNGAETIDGAATKVISTNYGSVTIYSNGTSWFSV